jgi:5S rRNA maturation endonuclease (ribonuclease M5)
MFVDQKDVFDKTNGGKDIILWIYPDANESFENKNRKFKARGNEKTASATVSFFNNIWWVIDYGGDQTSRNAIQLVMFKNNCDFKEALAIIANRFDIEPKTGNKEPQKPKYEISKRPATDDEPEKEYGYELKKSFSIEDLRSIFTDKVLQYAEKNATDNNKGHVPDKIEDRYKLCFDMLARYKAFAAKNFFYVENRRANVYSSTPEHPIIIIKENTFFKIYQPLHPEKKHRFKYGGEKPKNFVHGMANIEKQYVALNNVDDKEYEKADDDEQQEKRKEKKLSGIILATGFSDAINVALVMGNEFALIWLNSEIEILSFETYRYCKTKARSLYNLHDIDNTGMRTAHALSMRYMDIKNITLPLELATNKDFRGNACKDVRDYFKHYSISAFKKLVENAICYEFWREKIEYNRKGEPIMIDGKIKIGYEISNVHLYNFLQKNGFGKIKINGLDDDFYIKVNGNIVKEIKTKEIRSYINNWLKETGKPIDMRNTFFRSTQMSETSLQNLEIKSLDFKDYGKYFQFMFFKNKVWKVTAKKIYETNHGENDKYIWQEEVIDRSVELMDDFFKIEYNKTNDDFDIEITNNDCLFFKYLINSSRIFWREELEKYFEKLPQDLAKEYADQNKFNIAGSNLTPEQQHIQKAHLINKIYSIGYLMHRYKDASKAWWVLSVDNKIADSGEAHGGSGKSICYNIAIRHLLPKSFYKDGRDTKLTDDKHMLEGLTEFHRYMIIDDAYRYLNFGRFFGMITGETSVNPKGKTPYTIPFEKSPKGCITMNFMLKHNDPSTERRLLYTVFSDYYHFNKDGEYKQTRTVADDFAGRQLFTDFNEKEWNLFLNFAAQCLKFYLNSPHKVEPPMDNVQKRQMLDIMGEDFRDWADEYFAQTEPEHECNLNQHLPKRKVMEDFLGKYKQSKFSTQRFTNALKSYCRYNKLIYNPKQFLDEKGRILKMHEGKTTEMIFICSDEMKLIDLK